ncbi:AraC family transcriptional regulator [Herbiconiux ginsengi]|uniref:Helix-turn-helix domain-containing protein n=1 Tax=Herbiconiux ginsengi TaxID=381665 RepID=A0A1H3T0T2_9MICO|nr:AraC family transcriptional regulator [Herbiconiux ginsengi]SDZ43640.1 Helix-turn-helix domain-containing protein [Herbiconiux ginsengi]
MSRGTDPVEATPGGPGPQVLPGAAGFACLTLPVHGGPVRSSPPATGEPISLVLPIDVPVLLHSGDRAGFADLGARPGEAIVLVGPGSFSAAAATPSGGRLLVVSAPRAPIEALTGTPCSNRHLAGTVVLRATVRFLLDVTEGTSAGERPSMPALERLLREMIVAVLIDAQGTVPAEAHWVGLFDRAAEHIAGHRTDQGLGTESLARALNVSARQLQRVFAAAGSTPQREIRRHRAALAVSLLGDPAFAALSIDQIAHQCGFRNAADMRRALAGHDLPSPRELRAGSTPGGAGVPA